MRLVLAIFFLLLLIVASHAQDTVRSFRIAQSVKFLESTRADVRNLFAGSEADLDEDSDTFESPGVEVEVSYADGECSTQSDDNDFISVWNVAMGKVVEITIRFEDPTPLPLLTRDVLELTREQEDEDDPSSYVLFSKSSGVMFQIENGGVERIVLFPPAAHAGRLCKDTWAQQFYLSKEWSGESELGLIRDANLPANVIDLELSSSILEPTGPRTVSVVTSAADPENDVLTYNYVVSGGRIRGSGYKVIWDLTGMAAGTYTITAGVDDGCGICGRTITRSVIVR